MGNATTRTRAAPQEHVIRTRVALDFAVNLAAAVVLLVEKASLACGSKDTTWKL